MQQRPALRGMSESDVIRETETLLAEANDDERRVILYIVRRIIGLGRASYAALDLATDTRDGHVELNEELGDALFYFAVEAIKGKVARRPVPRLLNELWDCALSWSAQGARSKWSTAPSLRLYDKVQEIKASFRAQDS